jgi:hypothetical protein
LFHQGKLNEALEEPLYSYERYLKLRKIQRRRSNEIKQLEDELDRTPSKKIWYFEHHRMDRLRRFDREIVNFAS